MKIKGKMSRRKFVKISALVATATGVSALAINYGVRSAIGKARHDKLKMIPRDTKEVFKKCGACSHTFFYLLNREFGHLKETEERASDPLAGGLMLGHQCGMLWGSALAVGAESFRRNNDHGQAIASAITATQQLMKSFSERAKSVNCREITGTDITKKLGMAKFMLKIILHGGLKNLPCFNLAEKWAPEAIQSATAGLSIKQTDLPQNPVSCASAVVGRMGASDEEMVMVSGFAGGLGLKGHACGALGAAIWMNTLTWCKKHPGETPPQFNKPNIEKIKEAFYSATNAEILCRRISGQSFRTISDHAEFLKNGGCEKVINALSISSKI
jgi:hypothetical protein